MRLSLRTLLIVPFVLQVVGITSLVGYLSYRSSQQMIEELAYQLTTETSHRITEKLDSYLQRAHERNNAHIAALETGTVSLDDLDQMHRYLIGQHLQMPDIKALGFGGSDGTFLSSHRVSKEVFILERNGALIANSAGDPAYIAAIADEPSEDGQNGNSPPVIRPELVDFRRLTAVESSKMIPCIATLYAAPDAIVQALTNLLSNAIEFSEPGQTVWVEARAWTESASILFSVTDQGRGIPAEKLETIFDRFQQVDVSDARKKGGTGLGLAICKRIVQQHGGDIWVESELGHGSTFFFTVPINAL
jgi:signal transduction histidine kinase